MPRHGGELLLFGLVNQSGPLLAVHVHVLLLPWARARHVRRCLGGALRLKAVAHESWHFPVKAVESHRTTKLRALCSVSYGSDGRNLAQC